VVTIPGYLKTRRSACGFGIYFAILYLSNNDKRVKVEKYWRLVNLLLLANSSSPST